MLLKNLIKNSTRSFLLFISFLLILSNRVRNESCREKLAPIT